MFSILLPMWLVPPIDSIQAIAQLRILSEPKDFVFGGILSESSVLLTDANGQPVKNRDVDVRIEMAHQAGICHPDIQGTPAAIRLASLCTVSLDARTVTTNKHGMATFDALRPHTGTAGAYRLVYSARVRPNGTEFIEAAAALRMRTPVAHLITDWVPPPHVALGGVLGDLAVQARRLDGLPLANASVTLIARGAPHSLLTSVEATSLDPLDASTSCFGELEYQATRTNARGEAQLQNVRLTGASCSLLVLHVVCDGRTHLLRNHVGRPALISVTPPATAVVLQPMIYPPSVPEGAVFQAAVKVTDAHSGAPLEGHYLVAHATHWEGMPIAPRHVPTSEPPKFKVLLSAVSVMSGANGIAHFPRLSWTEAGACGNYTVRFESLRANTSASVRIAATSPPAAVLVSAPPNCGTLAQPVLSQWSTALQGAVTNATVEQLRTSSGCFVPTSVTPQTPVTACVALVDRAGHGVSGKLITVEAEAEHILGAPAVVRLATMSMYTDSTGTACLVNASVVQAALVQPNVTLTTLAPLYKFRLRFHAPGATSEWSLPLLALDLTSLVEEQAGSIAGSLPLQLRIIQNASAEARSVDDTVEILVEAQNALGKPVAGVPLELAVVHGVSRVAFLPVGVPLVDWVTGPTGRVRMQWHVSADEDATAWFQVRVLPSTDGILDLLQGVPVQTELFPIRVVPRFQSPPQLLESGAELSMTTAADQQANFTVVTRHPSSVAASLWPLLETQLVSTPLAAHLMEANLRYLVSPPRVVYRGNTTTREGSALVVQHHYAFSSPAAHSHQKLFPGHYHIALVPFTFNSPEATRHQLTVSVRVDLEAERVESLQVARAPSPQAKLGVILAQQPVVRVLSPTGLPVPNVRLLALVPSSSASQVVLSGEWSAPSNASGHAEWLALTLESALVGSGDSVLLAFAYGYPGAHQKTSPSSPVKLQGTAPAPSLHLLTQPAPIATEGRAFQGTPPSVALRGVLMSRLSDHLVLAQASAVGASQNASQNASVAIPPPRLSAPTQIVEKDASLIVFSEMGFEQAAEGRYVVRYQLFPHAALMQALVHRGLSALLTLPVASSPAPSLGPPPLLASELSSETLVTQAPTAVAFAVSLPPSIRVGLPFPVTARVTIEGSPLAAAPVSLHLDLNVARGELQVPDAPIITGPDGTAHWEAVILAGEPGIVTFRLKSKGGVTSAPSPTVQLENDVAEVVLLHRQPSDRSVLISADTAASILSLEQPCVRVLDMNGRPLPGIWAGIVAEPFHPPNTSAITRTSSALTAGVALAGSHAITNSTGWATFRELHFTSGTTGNYTLRALCQGIISPEAQSASLHVINLSEPQKVKGSWVLYLTCFLILPMLLFNRAPRLLNLRPRGKCLSVCLFVFILILGVLLVGAPVAFTILVAPLFALKGPAQAILLGAMIANGAAICMLLVYLLVVSLRAPSPARSPKLSVPLRRRLHALGYVRRLLRPRRARAMYKELFAEWTEKYPRAVATLFPDKLPRQGTYKAKKGEVIATPNPLAAASSAPTALQQVAPPMPPPPRSGLKRRLAERYARKHPPPSSFAPFECVPGDIVLPSRFILAFCLSLLTLAVAILLLVFLCLWWNAALVRVTAHAAVVQAASRLASAEQQQQPQQQSTGPSAVENTLSALLNLLAAKLVSLDFEGLRRAGMVGLILGGTLATLIMLLVWRSMFRTLRQNLVMLRRGQLNEMKEKLPIFGEAPSFVTGQVSQIILAWALLIFIFFVLSVFFGWTPLRVAVWMKLRVVLLSLLSTTVLMKVMRRFVVPYFFVKGHDIRHPRFLHSFDLISILIGLMSGIVGAFIRLIKARIVVLVKLVRLDVCVTNQIIRLDSGHMSYLSMCLMSHQYHHPVFLLFTDDLVRRLAALRERRAAVGAEDEAEAKEARSRARETQVRRRGSDRELSAMSSSSATTTSLHAPKYQKRTREERRERRRKIAAFRWHLAVTLIHNPSVRVTRKHVLARLPEGPARTALAYGRPIPLPPHFASLEVQGEAQAAQYRARLVATVHRAAGPGAVLPASWEPCGFQ